MNITIRHNQESIDPSATYTEDEFNEVKLALEIEYEKAILAEYPEANIEFSDVETYALMVQGADDDGRSEDAIHDICERVFETGNFWI